MSGLSFIERIKGAIWGQFIGDAAALGSHWYYDIKSIQERFPQGINGFEEPDDAHYHKGKKRGASTHYGEAALLLLESLVEKGKFDPIDFGSRFLEFFAVPEYRGYLDNSTMGTIKNYRQFVEENEDALFDFQLGANDDQMGTASRLVPVVVLYLDSPELMDVVESVTLVTQNNERAIAYMKSHARVLKRLFHGLDLIKAFEEELASKSHENPFDEEVHQAIQKAFSMKEMETKEATLIFGQSCPLQHSFPASVQAALKQPYSFEEAVLSTLRAGGDNAGRAALVGAWLGASQGERAIPKQWIGHLQGRKQIENLMESLIKCSVVLK